jgi:hypothetical protein
MKKLTLIVALISFNSFAFTCPDLSGKYAVCRSKKNILLEGTDLNVKKTEVPGNTFYSFSFLQDGNVERSQVLFPANGIPVKIDEETSMYARCLSDDLLMTRTTVMRDGKVWSEETSQYFKQGTDLVRISRGYIGEMKYTDILTCR